MKRSDGILWNEQTETQVFVMPVQDLGVRFRLNGGITREEQLVRSGGTFPKEIPCKKDELLLLGDDLCLQLRKLLVQRFIIGSCNFSSLHMTDRILVSGLLGHFQGRRF